jgi:hypothetical protein
MQNTCKEFVKGSIIEKNTGTWQKNLKTGDHACLEESAIKVQ